MFTGIIEQLGTVKRIEKQGENVHFTINAEFTNELKIDQSVAHNGCCCRRATEHYPDSR